MNDEERTAFRKWFKDALEIELKGSLDKDGDMKLEVKVFLDNELICKDQILINMEQ